MKTRLYGKRYNLLMLCMAMAFSTISAACTANDSIIVNKNNTSRITINGKVYEVSPGTDISINGDEVVIRAQGGNMIISNSGSSVEETAEQKRAQEQARVAREQARVAREQANTVREKALKDSRATHKEAQKEFRKTQKNSRQDRKHSKNAGNYTQSVFASSSAQSRVYSTEISKTIVLTQNQVRLESDINVDIKYIRSGEPSIHIAGQQVGVNSIGVSIEGKTVKLYPLQNVDQSLLKGVTITVRGKSLTSVSLLGAGNFSAKELIGSNVELKTLGSGELNVDNVSASIVQAYCDSAGDLTIGRIDSNTAAVNMMGAGDVKIGKFDGTVFRVQSSGAGDLQVDNIVATSVEAYLNGAGDASLKNIKSEAVKAYLNGVGDLTLTGNSHSANLYNNGIGDIKARGLKASRVSKSNLGMGEIYQ
ncbi:MAG: DUF2807 domain-containing protein [Muribaculaceae bacterium]|nr:DUF2807 domain-containing protein [Muribaculaceae bacterium]